MPTTTVPMPSTPAPSRRSFDRSLTELVGWLDGLAATAATAVEPTSVGLATLSGLLGDVYRSWDDNRGGDRWAAKYRKKKFGPHAS